MFLNSTRRSNKTVRNFKEAVEFLRENKYTMEIVSEYIRCIRLMPTNYSLTTVLQDRMNNIAILHIYNDMVDKLNIEKLLDKFIS